MSKESQQEFKLEGTKFYENCYLCESVVMELIKNGEEHGSLKIITQMIDEDDFKQPCINFQIFHNNDLEPHGVIEFQGSDGLAVIELFRRIISWFESQQCQTPTS